MIEKQRSSRRLSSCTLYEHHKIAFKTSLMIYIRDLSEQWLNENIHELHDTQTSMAAVYRERERESLQKSIVEKVFIQMQIKQRAS